MAAQRQALAFVLDVGPSMRSHLAGATAAIKAVVERKVIHYHNDELALVLVGSESSDNHVYTGEGMDDESRQAYAHIQTTHGLLSSLSVGLDILQTLQSASTGPGGADLLCAIAVAIDLFKQRPSSRLKRRMVLITAGEEPAPELDADFIDGICAVCRELDMCARAPARRARVPRARPRPPRIRAPSSGSTRRHASPFARPLAECS